MVDARLPAEWLGSIRIDNLSDRAFRVLAGALMWCNGQGTDGVVPSRYTKYLHPDGDDPVAFEELERAGLWTREDEGFVLTGWNDELRQSTAEEVQRYREAARRRQRAYRERRKGVGADGDIGSRTAPWDTGDVTRDATSDVTPHVGSGSLSATTQRSAYVTRDVTHRPGSPFCSKHPDGTNQPCGACARARVAREAREPAASGPGWDCAQQGHKFVADGSCAVCSLRPRRSVV